MRKNCGNGALLHCLQTPELAHLRDVTIHAGGESFLAHRVVLASSSAILAKKLGCNTRELHIANVSAATWRTVQDYMYKGELIYDTAQVKLDTIVKVMVCAQHLEMRVLVGATEHALIEKLSATNCCVLLELAHRHALPQLKQRAMTRIRTRRENKQTPYDHLDITSHVLKFVMLVLMLAIFFGIAPTPTPKIGTQNNA